MMISSRESNRKYTELILTLKDTVKYLIKYVHSNGNRSSSTKNRLVPNKVNSDCKDNNDDDRNISVVWKDEGDDDDDDIDDDSILNEKNEFVNKTCEIIEKMFIEGIKIIEFQNQIPLWGLFEQLDLLSNNDPSIYPFLRSNMDIISSHHEFLRIPIAKARAMIRQCLNCHCIDDMVSCVVKHPQLVSHFYYRHSIFHSKEDTNIFVSSPSFLNNLCFILILQMICASNIISSYTINL